jgi:hypothetical protein
MTANQGGLAVAESRKRPLMCPDLISGAVVDVEPIIMST